MRSREVKKRRKRKAKWLNKERKGEAFLPRARVYGIARITSIARARAQINLTSASEQLASHGRQIRFSGPKGEAGQQGLPGLNGTDGDPGIQGPPGLPVSRTQMRNVLPKISSSPTVFPT